MAGHPRSTPASSAALRLVALSRNRPGIHSAKSSSTVSLSSIMSTATTTKTSTDGATLRLWSTGGEPQAVVSAPSTTHKQDLDSNPFQRVWRGDKAGKIKMPGVPTFDDKYEERTWVKQHMAGCFRYWGKLGFGEGTAGHITVRDPVLTDHYWMNPFGMHFSLIKVGDRDSGLCSVLTLTGI